MPPGMNPQQIMALLAMLHSRGPAGMPQNNPQMGNLYNALLAQQMGGQAAGAQGPGPGSPMAQNPQYAQMMAYLMGQQGGGGSGFGQQWPTMAQLMAAQGGNTAQQTMGFPQQ